MNRCSCWLLNLFLLMHIGTFESFQIYFVIEHGLDFVRIANLKTPLIENSFTYYNHALRPHSVHQLYNFEPDAPYQFLKETSELKSYNFKWLLCCHTCSVRKQTQLTNKQLIAFHSENNFPQLLLCPLPKLDPPVFCDSYIFKLKCISIFKSQC